MAAKHQELNALYYSFSIRNGVFEYEGEDTVDDFEILMNAVARDRDINGIDIGEIYMKDNILDVLTNMLKHNPNITSLSLHQINSGNGFMPSKSFTRFLDFLSTNNNITHLGYYNMGFYPNVKSFADMIKTNKTLKSLDLFNDFMENNDIKILSEALTVNHTLTSIDLSNNQFDDTGLEYLFEAFKSNYSLTTVELLKEVDPDDINFDQRMIDDINKETASNAEHGHELLYRLLKNI